MLAITDWPEAERPREKFLAQGPSSLSDAELLAIFLRTGVRGKTAVDLARELIQRFGSLRTLLEADLEEFCRAPGLGKSKFVQLKAILELGNRHLYQTLQTESPLTDAEATKSFLLAKMRGFKQEVFACLFLDVQHCVIDFEELFTGTIHSTSIYPREVVKRALYHNAASVIFAHNHPSGKVKPSKADKNITRELTEALDYVDVRVLDHIIVGDGRTLSFVQEGIL